MVTVENGVILPQQSKKKPLRQWVAQQFAVIDAGSRRQGRNGGVYT